MPSSLPARGNGAASGEAGEGGEGVFGDGVGVAAGGGGPGDAGFGEPFGVEVVGAGGGGGDEFDGGAVEQVAVDAGFGADDQGAGAGQVFAADVAVGQEGDVAQGREGVAAVQDAGGADNLHGAGESSAGSSMAVTRPLRNSTRRRMNSRSWRTLTQALPPMERMPPGPETSRPSMSARCRS